MVSSSTHYLQTRRKWSEYSIHLRKMGFPTDFNRIGEPWILKWDGTASTVTVVPALSQVRVGNRIEWVWGVNEGQQRVVFSGIDLNDPPRNVRLCEARHEALLDAGELFNPDWLAKVREGSGIVRFMCWQSTNGDVSTRTAMSAPCGSRTFPTKAIAAMAAKREPPSSGVGCR